MDFSQVRAITIPEGSVNRILSGATVLWKKKTGLPAEYQEVEYIKSTGTQYIDTNLLYAANDRIEVDVAPVVITLDKVVFGSYISSAYVELGILTSKFRFDISSDATTPITENVRYKVVKDGATWTVDGNTITTSGRNKDTTYPIYLFGRCSNGTASKMSSIKVYSYKHIRNNVAIADLIPCYRKIDNVAGMYDVVNGVFYTNAGTGKFNVGADIITVPSEYQKVSYIQSTTNKCYIRTGVVPTDNTRMEMQIYTTCTDSFYASGSRSAGGTIFFGQTGTRTKARVSASVNEPSVQASTNGTLWSRLSSGQMYEIMLQTNGDGTYDYEINDTTHNKSFEAIGQSYTPMGDVKSDYDICIFALSGSYIIGGTNRLYKYRLYQGGNLVRDYVPCYRVSDNVVGLYDLVSKEFLVNAGTREFTAGPDIT